MPQQNRSLFSALLCLLPFVAITATAQTMKPITGGDAAKLASSIDRTMLPQDAKGAMVDKAQVAALKAPHAYSLVPVRFEVPNHSGGGSPMFQCGIFFIPQSGRQLFVTSFGVDFTETESCGGLIAIGTALTGNSQPTLILIYRGNTGREDVTEPVLLTWDEATSLYKPNQDLTQQVNTQVNTYTIPNIRKQLALTTPQK